MLDRSAVPSLVEHGIPLLGDERPTYFLVVSPTCGAAAQWLSEYDDMLDIANEAGYDTRVLVTGSEAGDHRWFNERFGSHHPFIVDHEGRYASMVGTVTTPSVVTVTPDGRVSRFFSPIQEWPPTLEALTRPEVRSFQTDTEDLP